jgi:Holliday junction resolvase RusA-like endonuclease
VFTNSKVAKGMRAVAAVARLHTARVLAAAPFGSAVALSATYLYAYPKGTPKKHLVDNRPMPSGADLDNRDKAVMDALTQAGWWPDDRYVTDLHLRKRRTTGLPRIVLAVSVDPEPPPATHSFL